MTAGRLSKRSRQALLTWHIATSVALIGIAATQLALGIAAQYDEPARRRATYGLMLIQVYWVIIPIVGMIIINSLLSGYYTKWGVLRYWWIVSKELLLIVTVALAVTTLRPALIHGHLTGQAQDAAVLIPAIQILAWTTATALSVFKPGSLTPRRASPQHPTPSLRALKPSQPGRPD